MGINTPLEHRGGDRKKGLDGGRDRKGQRKYSDREIEM